MHAGHAVAVDVVAHDRAGVVKSVEQERPTIWLEVDFGLVRASRRGDTVRREQGVNGRLRRTVCGQNRLVDRQVARVDGHLPRRESGRVEEASRLVRLVFPTLAVKLTILLHHLVAVVPLDAEHHVAPAAFAVEADQGCEAGFLTIALCGAAGLEIHIDAFEVVPQNEVDDARERVGAVYGGGTARDRFDALDGRGRDGVQVDDERGVRRLRAAPVDEHERSVRADTTQIHACDTRRDCAGSYAGARVELGVVRHELRHLIQHALNAERARVLERLRVDRHDGTRRIEVAANDARARDGDFFEPGFLRLCCACPGEQRRDRRREHGAIDELSVVAFGGFHSNSPTFR